MSCKNYPGYSPTRVEEIADRADQMFGGVYVYADYNDLEHCMAIFQVNLDDWIKQCETARERRAA